MIMEKRIYSSPQTEVTHLNALNGIMKTSIGMDGNNMPGEPGGAPRRRDSVF
jgi:hypothetical protein